MTSKQKPEIQPGSSDHSLSLFSFFAPRSKPQAYLLPWPPALWLLCKVLICHALPSVATSPCLCASPQKWQSSIPGLLCLWMYACLPLSPFPFLPSPTIVPLSASLHQHHQFLLPGPMSPATTFSPMLAEVFLGCQQ